MPEKQTQPDQQTADCRASCAAILQAIALSLRNNLSRQESMDFLTSLREKIHVVRENPVNFYLSDAGLDELEKQHQFLIDHLLDPELALSDKPDGSVN